MAYSKDDPKSVQTMFSSIAPRYDMTNLIISLGLNKYWNRQLVKHSLSSAPVGHLLDLCCGTGEIAYGFLNRTKLPQKVHLIDFSENMLVMAKQRAEKLKLHSKHELTFTQGDAQAIPLDKDSVACVSIAYGIRNVYDTKKCLAEVLRVLQPGGICGILELTRPKNKVMHQLHKIYLSTMLPLLGKLLTSNQDAYSYLKDTVGKFIEPEEIAGIMQNTGFRNVRVIPLSFGIAHLIVAEKSI
ncbi:MAG: bifunctional demethylmenaquinone methyltransferase/2-methoxy-6-polyprenyl-1,4-benzoquinol methylase UbiE [Parachlamydiales bacterium]|jgi:demethylmenaquinone methyltransferase/2-methoxy-6-polyprenyl-1,4-benzoquinol methylase